MFNNFDLEGCKILKDAEKEKNNLKHSYVGSEHLLLSILKNSKEITNILKEYNITYESFKKELIKTIGKSEVKEELNLYTPLLKRIISSAIELSSFDEDKKVLPRHYLLALLEEEEGIAFRLLLSMGIDIEELRKSFLHVKDSSKSYLSEIGINLNEKVLQSEKIYNRDDEINNIIEILIRKNKNNLVLVGEAGVGKTAIVEELARRIQNKNVPEFLESKKIIMLEMGSLVAGTKYRGEFEEKVTKLINEAINDKNVILFIDEIHTIINAGGAEGAINASDILKPYLARGELKCIGATTPLEYEKTIVKDKALSRRFEKIIVTEPNKKELLSIMMGIKKEYEKFHNINITKENILDIIELTDKYITNKYNPDKSIDILDTVCAYVKLNEHLLHNKNGLKKEYFKVINEKESAVKNNRFEEAIKLKEKEFLINQKLNAKSNKMQILKKDIIKVINDKLNNPNHSICIKEMKKVLSNSLKNKKDLIEKITNSLEKHFSEEYNKPLVLNFLGGQAEEKKTITQSITDVYKKNYILNLDFKDPISLNNLIGVSLGYAGYDSDYLLKNIKDNNFSIIIINNFDKGSEKVKSFIKNMAQKGKYFNGLGEQIFCLNTMFILINNCDKQSDIGFKTSKKITSDYDFGININFRNNGVKA